MFTYRQTHPLIQHVSTVFPGTGHTDVIASGPILSFAFPRTAFEVAYWVTRLFRTEQILHMYILNYRCKQRCSIDPSPICVLCDSSYISLHIPNLIELRCFKSTHKGKQLNMWSINLIDFLAVVFFWLKSISLRDHGCESSIKSFCIPPFLLLFLSGLFWKTVSRFAKR
jgi:hypothetical protein